MRRLISLALFASLSACGNVIFDGGPSSPDDPADFHSDMFDQTAFVGMSPADKAYVQGHALAVYTYGKALPRWVARKGFFYAPGVSSPDAQVAYDWGTVMIAESGGLDGEGGVEYVPLGGDDVFPGDNPGDDYPCPGCDGGSGDGDGSGGDDGGGGGSCSGTDDVCPGGDGGDGGDYPPPDDDDPFVDPDCEEFLDPAAMVTRSALTRIDVDRILDDPGDAYAVQAFYRGLNQALYLEDLDEDTDQSEVQHIKREVRDYGMCEHSPLVLDLDGNGIEVSAVRDGVLFDLRASGQVVRTAWPTGDGLLALDWNQDGEIGDGSELFGNVAAANGFDSLGRLDRAELGGNGDGQIDARDALFARLVVWRDTDRDGHSDADELSPLAELGIVAIPTSYSESDQRDENRNRFAQTGVYRRAAGASTVEAALVDVWFRYRRP